LCDDTSPEDAVESSGFLGTLWVGLGLGAFYIALIWVNTLLGIFLTPLFLIPLTWLQDAVARRRRDRTVGTAATAPAASGSA